MKKLSELYNVNSDVEIKGIKINSKEVEIGDLFICTKGVTADRHDFIDMAIENGASAIVVGKDGIKANVPIIRVPDPNKELPLLCARFYDHPEDKLKIIGVTGTDGKTSVSTIIQTLLGKNTCGYIGTNGRSCAAFDRETSNTTPDSDKLYEYFDEFVKQGCNAVATEASSEAFFRGRIETISYDVSVITNVTSEHLNIHGSFENYLDCKCQLFRQTKKSGFSVLNKDDKYYDHIKQFCQGKVLTYGIDKDNDLQIVSFKSLPDHTEVIYKYGKEKINIYSPLLGDFNVYNLAAAMLVALEMGISVEIIEKRLPSVIIPGRME
ncbi:MAG: Mur ligase family protein, partial [Bacilli bacterium]